MLQPLLTRLDKLQDGSTIGEWKAYGYHITSGEYKAFTSCRSHSDAEFIASLVNAYPILRAEIERLQEVERKYEEMKR